MSSVASRRDNTITMVWEPKANTKVFPRAVRKTGSATTAAKFLRPTKRMDGSPVVASLRE